MANKKKGKKPSGASFGAGGGGFGGQIGRISGSARFGGGVGLVGPGKHIPPDGTPSYKKKANMPIPKLNPRRGNR